VNQEFAMSKIIPEEKARQGRWGRHVLIVLIVGLVLAFIVWGILEIYGQAIEPPGGGTVGAITPPVSDRLLG